MEIDQDGTPILPTKIAYVHLKTYINGNKTILGRTCDPQELFEIKKCINLKLRKIKGLANVKYWPISSKNWEKQGGASVEKSPTDPNNPKEHFYRMSYDEILGKFELVDELLDEDIGAKLNNLKNICQICDENQFDGKIEIKEEVIDQDSSNFFENKAGNSKFIALADGSMTIKKETNENLIPKTEINPEDFQFQNESVVLLANGDDGTMTIKEEINE